ncbi:hypothetical protein E3N88_32165 [Mikania micrantha]|uniref:Integrase catalytic domain-containing protein n=1 Tax=Mikania micrantha TaxID=192012 RepID=A0A5N6M879_9ASTR|nr:hypothetical protein E3N88_32165 [Mikania micrantha]
MMAFSSQDSSFLTTLQLALQKDDTLQQFITTVLKEPLYYVDYKIHNGLVLFRCRLVIPDDPILKQQLLIEFHESTIGGHSGVTRTFHRLSSTFYWKLMRSDVKNFVANCQICQQVKSSSLLPAGLLQPLPIPSLIFEHIAMDFIMTLPLSHGFTVILVIVDHLSKYAHFVGLLSNFTSLSVAAKFVQEFIRLHGVPVDIVSDRDSRFMADFWKALHPLQGTTLSFCTAYHPQSDGQTEVLNKCFEMYLRYYVIDRPSDWFNFLPWAEYWYNTSLQTAAQMTPFEVVYGRKPPNLTCYIKGSTSNSLMASQLLDRDEVLTVLKHNLFRAQSRMKTYADTNRRDVQFDIRDWVFVKLQPFRQHSVRLQRHYKLSRRFFGPYQIMEKVGQVAYKLHLPPEAKIHNVFHVSMLRKCKGTPTQQITPLQLVDTVRFRRPFGRELGVCLGVRQVQPPLGSSSGSFRIRVFQPLGVRQNQPPPPIRVFPVESPSLIRVFHCWSSPLNSQTPRLGFNPWAVDSSAASRSHRRRIRPSPPPESPPAKGFKLNPLSHCQPDVGSVLSVSGSGLSTTEATWEDKSIMQQYFPAFRLEDKVNEKGEGNVVTQKANPKTTSPRTMGRGEGKKSQPAKLKDYGGNGLNGAGTLFIMVRIGVWVAWVGTRPAPLGSHVLCGEMSVNTMRYGLFIVGGAKCAGVRAASCAALPAMLASWLPGCWRSAGTGVYMDLGPPMRWFGSLLSWVGAAWGLYIAKGWHKEKHGYGTSKGLGWAENTMRWGCMKAVLGYGTMMTIKLPDYGISYFLLKGDNILSFSWNSLVPHWKTGKASRTLVRVSGEFTEGPYPEDKGPGGIQKNSGGEKPGRRAINEEDKRTGQIHSLPLNHLSHKN